MQEEQNIFAGGCRQQSFYFIQTSGEDTHCFTTYGGGRGVRNIRHAVPQSRAQEALEIQLVSTETQLINLTESLGTVSFL